MLVAVFLAVICSAPASAASPRGRLHLVVHLGAALNDGYDACFSFIPDTNDAVDRAYTIAEEAARDIGIDIEKIARDDSYDSSCVYYTTRTISIADGLPHERKFEANTSGLAGLAEREGLRGYEVVLCVPAVRVSSLAPGFDQKESDCPNQRGFRWINAPRAAVVFRATLATLGKGVAGTIIYWGVLLGILGLVVRWLNKGERWGWFVYHPLWGGLVVATVVMVILFFWTFGGAYWTNFIPSLQMLLHIGVPGEVALVAGPAVVLTGTAVSVRHRAGRVYRLRHAGALVAETNGIAGKIDVGPLRRTLYIQLWLGGPFLIAWFLARGPFSDRFHVIGPIAWAAIVLLSEQFLFDRLMIALHHGRRLPRASEVPIIERLSRAGVHVNEIWVSSLPVAVTGGQQGWLFSAGTSLVRDGLLWESALQLSVPRLTGGLLSSLGPSLPRLAAALSLFLAVVSRAETSRSSIPWSVVGVATAIGAFLLSIQVRKVASVRKAAARMPDALELLKGMMYFARVGEATLPSWGASLTRGPRWNTRHRAHRRAERAIRRFAAEASISPQVYDDAAREFLGRQEN